MHKRYNGWKLKSLSADKENSRLKSLSADKEDSKFKIMKVASYLRDLALIFKSLSINTKNSIIYDVGINIYFNDYAQLGATYFSV